MGGRKSDAKFLNNCATNKAICFVLIRSFPLEELIDSYMKMKTRRKLHHLASGHELVKAGVQCSHVK